MKNEKTPLNKKAEETPSPSLIDHLAMLTSCTYLSDLKLPANRQNVRDAVETVSPEEFPIVQWIEASEYLLSEYHTFTNREEAYQFLLQHLETNLS